MFRDLIWVAVTCVGTYVEIHSIHISFVYYTEFIPQKQKFFFKKEKRILILCPTINKVTWLSLQALIQPSYLIMPQQTFPSPGKAYI